MKPFRMLLPAIAVALALANGAIARPPKLTPAEQASIKAAAAAATEAARGAERSDDPDSRPTQAHRDAAGSNSADEGQAAAQAAADSAMAEAGKAAARSADCPTDPYAPDPDGPQVAAPTAIDQPFGNAWLGAKDGKIRLVVFVDYACEFCRASQAVLDRLMTEEPDLTVVYRVMTNDPGGDDAANLSLAIARTRSHDEWSAFHHTIDTGNSLAPEAIDKALAAAGVKPRCYFTHGQPVYDNEASNEMYRNSTWGQQRKLAAFPSWVIGKGKLTSPIEYAAVKAAIARARTAPR